MHLREHTALKDALFTLIVSLISSLFGTKRFNILRNSESRLINSFDLDRLWRQWLLQFTPMEKLRMMILPIHAEYYEMKN